MKASELIKKLVDIISQYGDLDIIVDDCSYIKDIYEDSAELNEWEETFWIQIDTDYEIEKKYEDN